MKKLLAKIWLSIVGLTAGALIAPYLYQAIVAEPKATAAIVVVWVIGMLTIESLLTLIRQ